MRAEEAEVASKEDAAAVEFMVVVADEGMISWDPDEELVAQVLKMNYQSINNWVARITTITTTRMSRVNHVVLKECVSLPRKYQEKMMMSRSKQGVETKDKWGLFTSCLSQDLLFYSLFLCLSSLEVHVCRNVSINTTIQWMNQGVNESGWVGGTRVAAQTVLS